MRISMGCTFSDTDIYYKYYYFQPNSLFAVRATTKNMINFCNIEFYQITCSVTIFELNTNCSNNTLVNFKLTYKMYSRKRRHRMRNKLLTFIQFSRSFLLFRVTIPFFEFMKTFMCFTRNANMQICNYYYYYLKISQIFALRDQRNSRNYYTGN